jgi:gliding motility-associated-like protein
LWSNGATTQNISGLTAGAYTLTITDANLCGSSPFVFGLSDPTPFTVTPVITDVTCNGANNGSIVHTIVGGTAPFTILWNTGAVTQDLLGIPGGSYNVTITDASLCSYNSNYTVNEPAAISITSFVSAITTCGGNDGSITLTTVSGGTAPYTFAWNTGAVTQNISGLNAAAYSVTITDANLCVSTPFNFNLTDPVTFTVSNSTTDITCNGGLNGAVDLTITGGVLPLSFSWSNGATTEDISGLSVGTYTVNITDGASCTFISSYTINEPTAIAITSSFTNVTCNAGSNGSITLTTINGGVAPYTFLWSNGASTQNVAGLTAGAYIVTVSDNNGCPQTANFTISEPLAMTDNATLTNASTCGGSDGAITINAIIGGTPAYSFVWSTGAVTQNVSGLTAGLYSVTVTDANTCSQAFSYAISEPVTFTVTPTIVDVLCNGNGTGSISLAIAGGNPPLTIVWNTGATTANITSLVAGTYSVTIADASSCSFVQSYTISEPTAIAVVSSVTNTTSCGASDGDITLTSVSGGVGPYTFDWNTGATTQNITGLNGGIYTVTITDANLCPQPFSFPISNPTPFTVVPNITNVLCNGGSGGAISLVITGATAPTSILWNTGSTSNNIINLSAGSYTVTVTDASTCVFNGSYNISEPTAVDTLSIITTLTPVICPGSNEGSVLLSNITGGTPGYSYNLGGLASPTPNYTLLIAGTYTMTITDANSCDFYHSFIIVEPAPIAYTVSTTDAVCFGNNASLTFDPVAGGTPPYNYSIDGGVTYSIITTYTNLAPGIYSVFVRDANNCTYGYLVPVIRKQGPIPYIRVQDITCFGGRDGAIIIDSVFSGVTPFTFYFNGQIRGSSQVFTQLTVGNYQIEIEDQDCRYDITNYFLWNGVTYDTILTRDIFVDQAAQVTAEVTSLDTDRKNANGTAIVYNFAGGTFPYRYTLDTLLGYNSVVNDSASIGGLNKGAYKVFLLDTNNCKGEVNINIIVDFFIPNLITPNGDGQNDYFEIMALPRGSTLVIYNSWNERVYYNKNYDNSWDATGLSNSTYYYELSLPNGNSYKGWLQTMR